MKKEIIDYLEEQGIKKDETRFNLVYKMVDGFAERIKKRYDNPLKRIWWWVAIVASFTSLFVVINKHYKENPVIRQYIEHEYKGDRWILDTYCSDVGYSKTDTGSAEQIKVLKAYRHLEATNLIDTLEMLND